MALPSFVRSLCGAATKIRAPFRQPFLPHNCSTGSTRQPEIVGRMLRNGGGALDGIVTI